MRRLTDPDLERYAEAHTTPFPGFMGALAAETLGLPRGPNMLSGPLEGRFLETLVFATGARSVLEIGTFTGYSALAMAAALAPGGRVVTCDVDPGAVEVARRHVAASPYADRVEFRLGPALDTLATLDGPFDLVFVDADKTGYAAYYEALLPKLSERGLLVVDNTLWYGKVLEPPAPDDADTRAIVEFNAMVRDDPRVVAVVVPLRDGVTLVRRAAG